MSCISFIRNITVEPVLLLYMLATFMQYTVFQDLVYQKICLSSFNHSVCDSLYDPNNSESLDLVQTESSIWILISTVTLVVPSIVTANLLGSWGDSFGRKLPLAIPSIGGVFSTLVYFWMSLNNLSGPVWPIIIASMLSGIFGGFVSCIMAVMSYVSNVSSQESRMSRVTLLESMTFLGGTIGPFVGGAILTASGHAAVFAVIFLCHMLLIVYVFMFVPQVLPVEAVVRKHCSLSHLVDSVKTCFKPREENRRQSIILFLVCSLFIMTVTAGEMDVSYLYVKDKPLKWDYQTYSYYFGAKYALGSACLLLGTPLLRHCNVHDLVVCAMGIFSKIAGLVLLGLGTTKTLMFLVPLASMLSSFCIPALRSLLSKQVEPEELGKMFAFVASVENVCTLLGSVLFNSLYPPMRSVGRGFIFQFAAALQIIPLIIIWCSYKYHRSSTYMSFDNTNLRIE